MIEYEYWVIILCQLVFLPLIAWMLGREYRSREVLLLKSQVEALQDQVRGHCDRIARQSELLSKRAERGEVQ